MTKKEAIRKIERVKNLYAYESDFEALDMAVEALEENESLAKSLNDAVELIHKLKNREDKT